MRATQVNSYGGAEVVHIAENVPKPAVAPGEVLVKVHAAGVNPFDWKVREGHARHMAELAFPATPGGDFAGIVAETGQEVTTVRTGDEVYGQAGALSGHGSFAEFVPVKAASIASKPKNLDFIHAAAAPLAAVSAYQALVGHMRLQPGQKILIHGGAGGIGTFAVQLAKHIGAYVAATAAGNDLGYVKELGADECIDYTNQDFAAVLHGFDAVYDTVGGKTYAKSFQVLKRGGTIVSMVEEPDNELAGQYGVTPVIQFTRVTTERLNKVSELLDSGTLTVHVDKIFPLGQAGEALDYLHEGKHRGKIVIAVT